MSRGMTTDVINRVTSETPRRVLAIELDFDSGVSRITTAPFDVTFDGDTYVGVGIAGRVSAVEESGELAAYSLSMELSGIPRDAIALALTEPYQNRPATVWEVVLDDDDQPIDGPIIAFRGLMDIMTVDFGDTATVTLQCTNRLADWERPKITRYSDEDQQRLHPGDVGCQYAAAMENREVVWPAKAWFRNHAG